MGVFDGADNGCYAAEFFCSTTTPHPVCERILFEPPSVNSTRPRP